MLRWVIWLLVIANGSYFAWTQGYLDSLGLGPTEQREPERLRAQVHPETQRLLNGPRAEPASDVAEEPAPPSEQVAAVLEPAPPSPAPQETAPASATPVTPPALPAPAPEPAPAPVEVAESSGARSCWQAGAFTESQAETLRAGLSLLGLPAGSWRLNESRSGGRWIVYMGRYDNDEQLDRKKDELRDLKVQFREVSASGLTPGLALGTYSSEASAEKALKDLERKGVRTAQVAQERAESLNFTLRLPAVTTAQRNGITQLGGPLAAKPLQRCN